MVIYIHIPFCIKKCDYCDFLSGPCNQRDMEDYVKCLINEIKYYGDRYGKKGRNISVESIFFGGGTPSILERGVIARILENIRECYNIVNNAEITVEANPGTLTREKLLSYKEAGVNRLSIGLQSADDKELKGIGRIHTFAQFLDGYTMARECGFENINIDIMSALPYQSKESYKNTLEKVISLKPEHISAYSLILEEGTPLYERVEKLQQAGEDTGLPDEDMEREMYYMTKDILRKNGYRHYEISNYSLEGYECRHNCAYWQREDYLGVGLGAASCMDDVRKKNTEDMERYMKIFRNDHLCTDEEGACDSEQTDILTKEDAMAEFMFLGLRMVRGISKEKFKECFKEEYDDYYYDITKKLEKQGLLDVDGDRVMLTELGIDVSNMVLAEFII